jgi:hypothetical protein
MPQHCAHYPRSMSFARKRLLQSTARIHFRRPSSQRKALVSSSSSVTAVDACPFVLDCLLLDAECRVAFVTPLNERPIDMTAMLRPSYLDAGEYLRASLRPLKARRLNSSALSIFRGSQRYLSSSSPFRTRSKRLGCPPSRCYRETRPIQQVAGESGSGSTATATKGASSGIARRRGCVTKTFGDGRLMRG